MTVSYLNLVGNREAPDKTIRALLEDNWVAGNITGTLTPGFHSASEEPDLLASDDNTEANLIAITWFMTERVESSENEPNGDYIHHHEHVLIMDYYAESMQVLLDILDECERILWENAPDNGTRLNKSDGSASEADYFEQSAITMERISPEGTVDFKPNVSGELRIHFRKRKS